MKISKTFSALVIAAILAPMPAAASGLSASGLTNIDQGRSARRTNQALRERMAERRAIAAERRQAQLKRSESLRADRRSKIRSLQAHREIQQALRHMKLRMARERRIHRFSFGR